MLERYLQQQCAVDRGSPMAQARSKRVLYLSALVVVLSLFDLAVTLMFLHSTGIEEINPVAAFIMQSNSVSALVLFKLGSVFCSVSIILLVRHRPQGELAAWVATAILLGLAIHWSNFTAQQKHFQDTANIEQAGLGSMGSLWLRDARH